MEEMTWILMAIMAGMALAWMGFNFFLNCEQQK